MGCFFEYKKAFFYYVAFFKLRSFSKKLIFQITDHANQFHEKCHYIFQSSV